MSSQAIRRPQLPALTSVRFFAAFAVLLFHLGATRLLLWPKFVTSQGYIGVSFFFVLSGFILVYSHADLPFTAGRFYRSRFARIYPAFAFALLVSLPLFLSMSLMPAMFGWASAHFKLTAAACLLLLQAWLPMAALAWNGVAWTLSVEAFFYLLFPFLLRRLGRCSPIQLVAIIGVCWLADLTAASLYLAIRPDGAVDLGDGPVPYFWKAMLKFNPVVHLPQFIIGMACGFLFLRAAIPESKRNLMVAAGLSAVIAVILFQGQIPYLLIHSGLLAPAFAAVIVGLAMQPRWSLWLNGKILVTLGNASYSLYLLHFTAIIYLFFILRLPFTLFSGVAYICGIVGLSVLVFRFLEEPARRWLSQRSQLPPPALQAESATA